MIKLNLSGSVSKQRNNIIPEAGVQTTVFNAASLTIVLPMNLFLDAYARASGPRVSYRVTTVPFTLQTPYWEITAVGQFLKKCPIVLIY